MVVLAVFEQRHLVKDMGSAEGTTFTIVAASRGAPAWRAVLPVLSGEGSSRLERAYSCASSACRRLAGGHGIRGVLGGNDNLPIHR
jgi:hypothetical protein